MLRQQVGLDGPYRLALALESYRETRVFGWREIAPMVLKAL